MQEAYELLSTPRRTVAVLAYLTEHPRPSPNEAAAALHLDLRTWYASANQLEALDFVAVERVPGGKKIKGFRVTPSGKQALEHLRGIAPLVRNTKAALQWDLREGSGTKGGAKAGEDLCRLVEMAERKIDLEELAALERMATEWSRQGEAHLARGVRLFLLADSDGAGQATKECMELLKEERTSRSYLKALHTNAAARAYTGDMDGSWKALMVLRVLAREAHDAEMEAEAWLGLAVHKSRVSPPQFEEAAKFIVRGLECARSGGLVAKEAKLLANLAYVQVFLDRATALKTSEEALRAARSCGATLAVGRTQLNRALILAVMGNKEAVRESLEEARALFRAGGEEHGPELVERWGREVRRILRDGPNADPASWQARIIALSRAVPERPTSGAPVATSGNGAATRQR